MDELINDMKQKGLVSFISIGKARAVFDLLNLMATTEPIETDPDWWELRLFLRVDRPYPIMETQTQVFQLDAINWACRLALVRN